MTEKEIREKLASFSIETDLFIDGKYVRDFSDETYTICDPGDKDITVATIRLGSIRSMNAAVRAARQAFDMGDWSRMSIAERSKILLRFAEKIRENAEMLALIETLSIGKLHEECLHHEVARAADNIEYAACAIRAWEDKCFNDERIFLKRKVNIQTIVKREPLGVGGIIIPWNGPILHSTWKLAAPLALGNSCVIKPPAWGALSVLQLGRLANEAGIPLGVLNIVPGERLAGEALVANPLVDRISFTGSSRGGKAVVQANAQVRLAPPSLELGGKNPNIVFADANLDFTVEGVARSCFRSQGQSCVAGSRVLVEKSKCEEFTDMFVRRVRAMRIGHQTDPKVEIGPVITEEHLKHIENFVETGIQEKATLLCGGDRPRYIDECQSGNFYEPTIFSDVTRDMTIWKEEAFGPVVVIMPFTNEREAIKLANDTPFGLSANVWVKDIGKANRVADALDTGMVWINGHFLRDLRAPFGGRKDSGFDSEGGDYSRLFWTKPKMICTTYEQ